MVITHIHVNGFKSLRNFDMDLKIGPNILVGPNGSGKTNIISFFEFISCIVQRDLHEAIGMLGGASSIFQKVGETAYCQSISASIFGTKHIRSKQNLSYVYDFEIVTFIEKGIISYKSQRLRILKTSEDITISPRKVENISTDLDISEVYRESNPPNALINRLNLKKIRTYGESIKREDFEKMLTSNYRSMESYSLVQILLRFFEVIRFIFDDLYGGEVFNIIPSRVKQPEDIAKQPGIEKDGTGLAATLFALTHQIDDIRMHPYFRFQYRRVRLNPEIYNKIVEFAKLANSSITNISVQNNAFDNHLLVRIAISADDKTIFLPLSSMSDGTLKWITLITAILTSSHIFSIEEPENFLHPWMQSEILKIMRSNYSDKKSSSFILMSTHSETLLNSSKSPEIVVVSMENGFTKARRINDPELLTKEISRTGFGLGHYYISGGLQDA